MNIEKLLALLQTEALHFSQLKRFRDPFEGAMPIAWEGCVPHAGGQLIPPTTDCGGSEGWLDVPIFPENGEHLRDEKLPDELYVSCWHNSKAESAAMWSLYSRESGIAIKSTGELLTRALRDCKASVEIAAVEYLDMVPGLISGKPWALKRPNFQHEMEVRACIRDPSCGSPGLQVPVDVDALVVEIYVSPESEQWVEAVVRDVASRYGLRKPVQRSDLYAPIESRII